MRDRTFTEEEVAALFRRAAELQTEEARSQPSGRPGLTLDEVSAIAAEVGLDPDHVELAAGELARKSAVKARGESSVRATEIFAERCVETPVGAETIDNIIAELRHRFDTPMGHQIGMPGYGTSSTETIGRSVGWKHKNLWGIETRVLLQPQGNQFRARVSRQSEWGGITDWTPYGTSYAAVLALVAGFLAAPAFGSYLLGILVAIATLLVTVPLVRTLNNRWVESQRREIEELADSIADQAVSTVDDAAFVSTASDASYQAPEVSLPDDHSEPSGPEPNRRNRNR